MANPMRVDKWEYLPALGGFGQECPLDDYTAFERNRQFRWVYDKYQLHERMNDAASFIEEIPYFNYTSTAFITKPRISLNGLARRVKEATTQEVPPGYVAQEYLQGIYRSTDYLVTEQTSQLLYSYRARAGHLGEFNLFWRDNREPLISQNLAYLLWAEGYRGYLNIETIGEDILEAHLRPALQFWDRPKYSIIFRKKTDAVPELDPDFEPALNIESVKSVQRCWKPGCSLSDTDPRDSNFRFLVVNADNLRDGYYFGNIYASQITWRDV